MKIFVSEHRYISGNILLEFTATIAKLACSFLSTVNIEYLFRQDYDTIMRYYPFALFLRRYKTAQELISHDIHNNTFNYKHTFSVELVPVCKVCVLETRFSLGLA